MVRIQILMQTLARGSVTPPEISCEKRSVKSLRHCLLETISLQNKNCVHACVFGQAERSRLQSFMKKKNVLNKVIRLWFCCIYLDKCQTFLYKYNNVAQMQLTVRVKFCLICLDTFSVSLVCVHH